MVSGDAYWWSGERRNRPIGVLMSNHKGSVRFFRVRSSLTKLQQILLFTKIQGLSLPDRRHQFHDFVIGRVEDIQISSPFVLVEMMRWLTRDVPSKGTDSSAAEPIEMLPDERFMVPSGFAYHTEMSVMAVDARKGSIGGNKIADYLSAFATKIFDGDHHFELLPVLDNHDLSRMDDMLRVTSMYFAVAVPDQPQPAGGILERWFAPARAMGAPYIHIRPFVFKTGRTLSKEAVVATADALYDFESLVGDIVIRGKTDAGKDAEIHLKRPLLSYPFDVPSPARVPFNVRVTVLMKAFEVNSVLLAERYGEAEVGI